MATHKLTLSASPPAADSTLFFLCDLQIKFRPAIYGFDHVVHTANKMIQVAKLLECGVLVTTQKASALGPTDPAVKLYTLGPLLIGTFDKTRFSMLTEEVMETLNARKPKSIVLIGIESHICILGTALGLLRSTISDGEPPAVYVLVDGVSSVNTFEIPVALEMMRAAGAILTTSESLCYQLIGDASSPHFKEFAGVMKNEKDRTKAAGQALLEKASLTGSNGPNSK